MAHELVLRIHGNEGEIDASLLSEALRLLKAASDAAAGRTVPLPLTKLESGSAIAAVGVPEEAGALVDILPVLTGTPASGDSERPGWPEGLLDAMASLSALGENSNGISIEDAAHDLAVTMNMETAERARCLKQEPLEAIATLRGRLCGYSNAPSGGQTVTIAPEGAGRAIRCSASDEILAKAIDLMERRVDATGIAMRDSRTGEIRSMRLHSIQAAPPRPQRRASARELIGLWKDLDWGGKDSVEIVREMRDAV